VALTCSRCGAHGRAGLVEGRLTCPHCGSPRTAAGVPLLVVTGAAATGKSTVCAGLAGTIPGLVALDADVMAAGAAAVTAGREDYRAFWAYLLAVSVELAENGQATAWCGIGLPEQLLDQPLLPAFTGVHLLALTCQEDTHRRRLTARRGGGTAAARPERHAAINHALTTAASTPGMTVTHLDTTALTSHETVTAAARWAHTALDQRI